MQSVLDQLDWSRDTEPRLLVQLVSTQLDEQEQIRQRVREQLIKDYPATALSWLPTVTWSSPTLVPLSSFDLQGIKDWPTWDDKDKIKTFTEKIKSGWHKPLVAIKTPGARYLNPIDGHTRLCVYWELKRPVLSWVGKAHAQHGPWEEFHGKQRDLTPQQRKVDGFVSVYDRILLDLVASGDTITEDQYRLLLDGRREARKLHPSGHPDRVAAERAVRQARRSRCTEERAAPLELVSESLTVAELPHSELLTLRRRAQIAHPPGHPDRVRAEREVRRSRAKIREVSLSS